MQQLSGKIWWQQVQQWLAQHWSRLIWKEIVFWTISHFKMQRTECLIHHLLHNNCTPNYASVLSGNTKMITHIACTFEEQNIPFTPIFRHIRTRFAFVDIFEFATNKAFDVCIGMSMLFWLGCFLKSGGQHFLHMVSSWNGHHWRIRGSPHFTVCRQCTTCVLCGCCLSQFQICVCVSRLVRRMPVSKFSLWQSVSTVTKSLSSPEGASCQFANSCVFIYWTATRILQWTCTETQQRF